MDYRALYEEMGNGAKVVYGNNYYQNMCSLYAQEAWMVKLLGDGNAEVLHKL